MSRLMDDNGWVIIIQTRWHEDDLIGPPDRPEEPLLFRRRRGQAVEADHHPCPGRGERRAGPGAGEALWPERFGVDYLLGFKRRNPRGFNALYQQRPTPDDGDFFKAEYIREYLPHERRRCDEAAHLHGERPRRGPEAGERPHLHPGRRRRRNDNIWVLDCLLEAGQDRRGGREADRPLQEVEPPALVGRGRPHHQVDRAVPAKRMRESATLHGLTRRSTPTPTRSKKAQAIQGRMAMGMVLFPKTAPWYQDARDELLKFPRGPATTTSWTPCPPSAAAWA
jgi:hypothetical protein